MTNLPTVPWYTADAIVRWLRRCEAMQRPPEQAAKLLGFIVLLDRENIPFPERKEVAQHLDISVATVDAVRSHRQATGHIKEVLSATGGTTQSRPSVHRQRFIVPSQELRDVVATAEKGHDGT